MQSSMNSAGTPNVLANERIFRWISYVLVFLMMTCISMALSAMIQNFTLQISSGILTGILLLIVIDRLVTYPRFKSLAMFGSEWGMTLAAQWIVFVVFIRLLLSYAKGLEAFANDIYRFTHGYLADLLSPDFAIALLLSALVWGITGRFLELLDELGLDQRIALLNSRAALSPAEDVIVPTHQRLANLVFGQGILLVIVTALALIDMPAVFSNPSHPALLLNHFYPAEAGVLFYFIFGLALLAQGRLLSLQTRWNVEGIPVSSTDLVKKWGWYSLFFLVLIILAVGLLPTGDSFGIFSILRGLLDFLWGVFLFVFRLIFTILMVLLSVPFFLFGTKLPVTQAPPQIDFPKLEPPPLVPESALWVLIRSILLWGGLLLIIGLSIRHFLKQHDDFRLALRKVSVIRWLILAWQWLRQGAERTQTALSHLLADGWQNLVSRLDRRRGASGGGWINFRALDPRRKVYFFYHAMLRQSAKLGLVRKPSQTPSEYAGSLEKDLPSAGEDIDAITAAFEEARYSQHDIGAGRANEVKTTWERIRRALQEWANRG